MEKGCEMVLKSPSVSLHREIGPGGLLGMTLQRPITATVAS